MTPAGLQLSILLLPLGAAVLLAFVPWARAMLAHRLDDLVAVSFAPVQPRG